MGYYIDLTKISIDQYKKILRSADLLPSWMVLKKNIEENFECIKRQDVKNLEVLKNELKNKRNLQEFSKRTDLSENYLNILRRVIRGYHPKPNRIRDFPHTSGRDVLQLEKMGIKTTLQLFDKVKTPENRKELCQQTGICEKAVLRLAKLTDLSRIRWVNHTFAFVLFEAGYDCSEKVAKADYARLYEKVKQLNEERKLYKAHIGLHDMKLCVEAAKGLSFEIEY